jgi:hypothetical protein
VRAFRRGVRFSRKGLRGFRRGRGRLENAQHPKIC